MDFLKIKLEKLGGGKNTYLGYSKKDLITNLQTYIIKNDNDSNIEKL
jgi:hypothetical protein